MDFVWFLIIALVSGVFAGMGMGGGTFLIPLLTIFMALEPSVSQCTNLLVFVPMAVVTIIIYAKQKLICFKYWWLISIPACILSGISALFSLQISGKVIKIIFGAFICLIGLIQIVLLCINHVKKKS